MFTQEASLPNISVQAALDPRDKVPDGSVDREIVAELVPVGDDAVKLEVAFADRARRGAGVAEAGAALLL